MCLCVPLLLCACVFMHLSVLMCVFSSVFMHVCTIDCVFMCPFYCVCTCAFLHPFLGLCVCLLARERLDRLITMLRSTGTHILTAAHKHTRSCTHTHTQTYTHTTPDNERGHIVEPQRQPVEVKASHSVNIDWLKQMFTIARFFLRINKTLFVIIYS